MLVAGQRGRSPGTLHAIKSSNRLTYVRSMSPSAGEHGSPVAVVHTGYRADPTIELTWALILTPRDIS